MLRKPDTKLTRRGVLLAAPAALAAAAPEMWSQPRALGTSGLKVTKLGMGVEEVRDEQTIRRAAELGINYFHAFGNQELVGRAIAPIRQRVVLAAGSDKPTRSGMLRDLDDQLRRFGTSHIDLWYLTSKFSQELLTDDLVEGLRQARSAGKIRACAVAGHGIGRIRGRLTELREVISASMVVCNFATWQNIPDPQQEKPRTSLPGGSREDIVELHKGGLGIVAMKPLMGGLKFIPDERKPWAAGLTSDERRRTALVAALKWALNNPHIDCVPVMTRNIAELEGSVRAAREGFKGSEQHELARVMAEHGDQYCRMCDACAGQCRRGLPVSDVLRYLLYAEGYGDVARGRAGFATLPAKLAQVRCGECGDCSVQCRTGAAVRERLMRAQTVLA